MQTSTVTDEKEPDQKKVESLRKLIPAGPFFTRKQAMSYLGVSSFMLWRFTGNGGTHHPINPQERIPSYKFGKTRMYRREELDWWAEKHRVA